MTSSTHDENLPQPTGKDTMCSWTITSVLPDCSLHCLHDKRMRLLGTVRINRKLMVCLDKLCARARLVNGAVSERRKGPLTPLLCVMCVSYKDNNIKTILLSTEASAGYTNVVRRLGRQVCIPRVVRTYNQLMGRVDLDECCTKNGQKNSGLFVWPGV